MKTNRYKDGVECRPGAKFKILENDGKVKLVVKDVQDGDKGDYTCELKNRKGTEAATVKLGVLGEYSYQS